MKVPFYVPRRFRYCSTGFMEHGGVTVTELTESRVIGHYGTPDDNCHDTFNVKRVGDLFCLGRESGKKRFYISDAEVYANLLTK